MCPQNTTESRNGIRYEPCVVSFIDILGFRALINTRTASEVYSLIKLLEKITLPHDAGTKTTRMSEARLYSRAFAQSVSDAIVRVRPYNTQYRDGALISELIDLLHAQIELIGRGVLIRAGVTVGDAYAGIDGEGPVFGPAFIRAYEIESKEAIFPRIMIDSHAIAQHEEDEQLRSENSTLEYEFGMLNSLLATDESGAKFIDYLSASSEFDDLASYLEFLQCHAVLVRKGYKANLGDEKTLRKYEWLISYHNAQTKKLHDSVMENEERQGEFMADLDIDPESFFESLYIR